MNLSLKYFFYRFTDYVHIFSQVIIIRSPFTFTCENTLWWCVSSLINFKILYVISSLKIFWEGVRTIFSYDHVGEVFCQILIDDFNFRYIWNTVSLWWESLHNCLRTCKAGTRYTLVHLSVFVINILVFKICLV